MDKHSMATDAGEAGAEMDRAVAERVMGWEWFRFENHYPPPRLYEWWRSLRDPRSGHYQPKDDGSRGHCRGPEQFQPAHGNEPIDRDYGQHPPRFSTEIAAAWEVVVAMKARKPHWCVTIRDDEEKMGEWYCRFERGDIEHWASDPRLPLAICRAALAALSPTPPR